MHESCRARFPLQPPAIRGRDSRWHWLALVGIGLTAASSHHKPVLALLHNRGGQTHGTCSSSWGVI